MDGAELNAKVKVLEEALRKANNRMAGAAEFEPYLDEALSALAELKSAASSGAVAKNDLRRGVAERSIQGLYAQLRSRVSALQSALQKLETADSECAEFLEKFRQSSAFKFPRDSDAIGFVEKICALYGIDEMRFKPQFLGVVDTAKISKDLVLRRAGNACLTVKPEKVAELVAYLSHNGIARNYSLEGADVRMVFSNSLEMRIDASEEKQRRIARLYKEQQQAKEGVAEQAEDGVTETARIS